MAAGIAGVDHARRLDQDNMGFALGERAVLDTAGYDEELSGPEGHVARRASGWSACRS